MSHRRRLPAILILAAAASAQTPVLWSTTRLDPAFRSEGVAVADVNADGVLDVLAGEVWYEGPRFKLHEIAPPGSYDPINGYSNCFTAAAADVDGDGMVDMLCVGFPGLPAFWYRNPGDVGGHWRKHWIATSACNESPLFVDVDGDSRLDLLIGIESRTRVAWLRAANPLRPWSIHHVSSPGQPGFNQFYHGLGYGDVNSDGRRDVLTADGWYEAPLDPTTSPWPFRPANLRGTGPTGQQMAAQLCVADFDGDGDQDVATSSPHSYGVWWWEQSNTTPGTFTEHLIDASFSQSHALVLADLNGDNLPDLVTGKRYYAHGPFGDPGSQQPAVLVWFELHRVAGQASFVRHVIHSDSGIGTQFEVADIDLDGRLDVITSNKKGVHVHLRQ
ncbi:MAG TPA: VCBS repeat-containing protein [Planctomycetota bacterium]|nr:VCBS repeat-containing protein [Planctomycetota bacterium]